MICASRRKLRNALVSRAQQIAALEADLAGVGFDQPQHQPAHGDLPQPDSPTSASVFASFDSEADAVDGFTKRWRGPNTDVRRRNV